MRAKTVNRFLERGSMSQAHKPAVMSDSRKGPVLKIQ